MYTSVAIIFNPNSTGDAPLKAHEIAKKLQQILPNTPIKLQKTKFAGHAEELAFHAARSGSEPLIISVSGDGGYYEVVNGAMRAANLGATPICAVYPASNANDHRRMVRRRPLMTAIAKQKISRIDLLDVHWKNEHRYAHSYVGVGLTPVVAVELNRHTLGSLKEMLIVMKAYWKYQPHTVELDSGRMDIDSLVIGNIPGMAKVIKLSEDGSPVDGKFEIIMVRHRNKLSMLLWAIKSATIGPGKQPQAERFEFKAIRPMPMQLDGEVVDLTSGTRVEVSIARRKLRTIR